MITNYFLKLISEDIYKHQEDTTIPHNYYIGLSSTLPDIDGGNVTEPEAKEYARIEIDNGNSFGEANDNVVSNNTAFYFPEAQSEWGYFAYYVIYDSLTNGNLLIYGELESPIKIHIKTVVKIPAEALQISVKNA